jgi:2-polyprenyl-3-methyl-5-hydroxy-6-metoxy-1,4-benzoquinol methylase
MTSDKAAYPAKSKYDSRQSCGYQQRKPAKHRAEMRLIDRAFALVPKSHRVLDVPCGGGRVLLHLAAQGYAVAGADFSEAMLATARENAAKNGVACAIERQDIERMTFADRSYDAVVCFRLFHHFPTAAIRQQVIGELCRVTAHEVVLSYFNPYSPTSLKRKLTGADPDRFATPVTELKGYFATNGFRLVKDFAQLPLVHTLHLAVFARTKP